MKQFRTHDEKIITGSKLQDALTKVANDYRAIAHGIRNENLYASHVTEEEKEQYLKEGLIHAEEVQGGMINSLSVWQRVNTELTGKCIALLNI